MCRRGDRRSAYTIIDELGRSTMFYADKRALVQVGPATLGHAFAGLGFTLPALLSWRRRLSPGGSLW